MTRGSDAIVPFRTLTDEQMLAVVREAAQYGKDQPKTHRWQVRPWWVPLMMVLCNYGCRLSEALTLRRDQVDFSHMEITFPTLKRRRPTTRTLPLFPEVATVLHEYLATRTDADPLVFPHRNLHTARSLVWKVFQKLLERAGIPPTKVHALRHSVATKLAIMDLATARDVLGHASLMTTDRYIHATRLHDVFERLIPIAPGNGPQTAGQPTAMADARPDMLASDTNGSLADRLTRLEGAVAFLAQTLGGGNGAFPSRPAAQIPITAPRPAPQPERQPIELVRERLSEADLAPETRACWGKAYWRTKRGRTELHARIVALAQGGLAAKHIANQLGVNRSTVWRKLKEARKRGPSLCHQD